MTPNEKISGGVAIRWNELFAGLCLCCDSNDNQWNCRNTPPLSDDIVKLAFVIADTGTHLRLEGFHWQNFYADINTVANIKGKMFYKEVVGHK